MNVDLSRPRDRAGYEFAQIRKCVLGEFFRSATPLQAARENAE
jgi:hypothetical protein